MPIIVILKNREAVRGYKPKRDYKKVAQATREFAGTIYEIDGVPTELFPISVFATALDRTPQTVRSLEKEQMVPTPLFHIPQKNGIGKKRLYSAAQVVNANRLLFAKYKGVKFTHNAEEHKKFFDELKTVFYQRDVVVAEDGTMLIPREQLKKAGELSCRTRNVQADPRPSVMFGRWRMSYLPTSRRR